VPPVTLLTDYGLADAYVGQLKGAILSICPTAKLIDLTHVVPPQDVRTGAFLLWTAADAFPPGSIHLAIVDPGVGTARRAVAAQCARGDLFVGPDNGLLGPALDRLGGASCVVELTNSRFWRAAVSLTFHGRDIFGPVAGHLAQGVPLTQLGSLLERLERPFAFPLPRRTPDEVVGEILHVDGFGTLITNIPGERVASAFTVVLKGQRIQGRKAAPFESVPGGSPLAVVGSQGLLEIAIREGNAAAALGASVGDFVAACPPAD
jgi:S-adenosylmethionine hydrolase